MFVECYNNNGIPYLRLVRSIRRPTKADPSKVSSYKQTELSIGPLSRFDDGLPDYVGRLKRSFREGRPLIASLKPYCSQPVAAEQHGMSEARSFFSESFAHPRRCAQILLDPIFRDLGLSALMAEIKHGSGQDDPLGAYLKPLVYGLILGPASADVPPVPRLYDALDAVYDRRLRILKRLDGSIRKGMGRDVSLLFCGAGLPIEADESDPDGTGARARLFVDRSGIPVSIGVLPERAPGRRAVGTACADPLTQMGFGGRRILVADGAPRGSADGWDGSLIGRHLGACDREVRRWAADPAGYTVVSDAFRYKSRTFEVAVRDGDGREGRVRRKSVAYWSRSLYEREAAASGSLPALSFALDGFSGETGEIPDAGRLLGPIGEGRRDEGARLLGYGLIDASEADMDDRAVIDAYRGQADLERLFEALGDPSGTLPPCAWTEARRYALLLIRLIALVMLRLIQRRHALRQVPEPGRAGIRTDGLSGTSVLAALRKWQAVPVNAGAYWFADADDPDLSGILASYGLDIQKKLYTEGEMRRLKRRVQTF